MQNCRLPCRYRLFTGAMARAAAVSPSPASTSGPPAALEVKTTPCCPAPPTPPLFLPLIPDRGNSSLPRAPPSSPLCRARRRHPIPPRTSQRAQAAPPRPLLFPHQRNRAGVDGADAIILVFVRRGSRAPESIPAIPPAPHRADQAIVLVVSSSLPCVSSPSSSGSRPRSHRGPSSAAAKPRRRRASGDLMVQCRRPLCSPLSPLARDAPARAQFHPETTNW